MALIATALVAFLIVNGSVNDSSDDSKKAERTTTASTTPSCAGADPAAVQAVDDGYYVLEEGEDLTNVADRTCIPVERLQELNPNLDPQLLPVGGCVDLVVDGCRALAQG